VIVNVPGEAISEASIEVKAGPPAVTVDGFNEVIVGWAKAGHHANVSAAKTARNGIRDLLICILLLDWSQGSPDLAGQALLDGLFRAP
jgi:hypothetical protein